MPIETISPAEAHRLIDAGASLIDIRAPDEHARERIAGALNVPLKFRGTSTRTCGTPK